MRGFMAMMLLGLVAGCAMQPSSAERAFLSAGAPRSELVKQDTQAILAGMRHAQTEDERIARSGR